MSSSIEHLHISAISSPAERNSSRLLIEPDCSSPTSWMFLGGPPESPPPPSHPSLLRASRAESSTNSSKNDSNPARNSSESSAGSYRSQDSGFSDSGENWVGRKKMSVHESFVAGNRRLSGILDSSSVYIVEQEQQMVADLYASPCTCSLSSSQLSSQQQQQYHPSPRLSSRNQSSMIQNPPSRPILDVSYSCQQQQEVILAHSANSRHTAFPVAAIEELGAPTCSSTPKRPAKNILRPSMVQKIDNFQSLNKNALKATDSNNNSSFRSASSSRGKENNSSPHFIPPGIHSTSSLSNFNCKNNETKQAALTHYSSMITSRGPLPPYQHPPKALTLPRGFKKLTPSAPAPTGHIQRERYEEPVVVRSVAENESMRLWLHELRYDAEPECLNTLQVKAIVNEPIMDLTWHAQETPFPAFQASRLSVTVLAIHSVSAPIISIRNIEQRACVISTQFSKICKHLEFGFFNRVPPLITALSSHVEEFLREYRESLGKAHKLEKHILSALRHLRAVSRELDNLLVKSDDFHPEETSPTSPKCLVNGSLSEANQILEEIVEGVVEIGNMFRLIVDEKLTRDLSSILDTIENGGLPARVGLQSYMTILTDGGLHMCRLAASIRTVRGLLGTLLDSKDDYAKLLALRNLSILLSIGEAVRDFDNAGGFEIITDILCDENSSVAMKHEALSVLAQASDPWLDLETTLSNLGGQIEKIIYTLTHLVPIFKSQPDTFLLLVATISNLTFLETASLRILKRHHTVWHLLSAVREFPTYSVFVLDHIATVLANMSGVEKCRKGIVAAGGVVALLCFLQQRPANFKTLPEVTACERVQQKSTIAISRLSNEEGVSRMIFEMNGVERIIELCRNEKERNYSDGVLIACLATLRKLITTCDAETVCSLDAQDLIQPRLLDSFLMYSSRQESYV